MTKVWIVTDVAAFAQQQATLNPLAAYVNRDEAFLHAKITHNANTSVFELDVAGEVKVGYQLWLVCKTVDFEFSAATRTKAAAIAVADRSGCYGQTLEWVPAGVFLGLWDSAELDFPSQVAEAVIAPVAVSARFRP